MDQALRERFARLGQVRPLELVVAGEPGSVRLRLAPNVEAPAAIDAIVALARRGLPMLEAKRVVEALLSTGEAAADLPLLENAGELSAELARAGVASMHAGDARIPDGSALPRAREPDAS